MEIFVGLLLAVILIMASARLAHADYYTVNGNRIREMSVDSLLEEYFENCSDKGGWAGYDSEGDELGTIILNVDDDDIDGLGVRDSLLIGKHFGDTDVIIELVSINTDALVEIFKSKIDEGVDIICSVFGGFLLDTGEVKIILVEHWIL